MLGSLLRYLFQMPVLFVPFALLFIYVMSRNYLSFRKKTLDIKLLDNEIEIDRLDTDLWIVRKQTLLTNQRIVQLTSCWFLSRRKIKSIALQDLHTTNWKRHANWIFLLAGILLWGLINPAAFIFLLLGLERKIYLIRFNTPFTSMPLTRISVMSMRRRQLNELWRFYKNAQLAWAKVRIKNGFALAAASLTDEMPEDDFSLGRPVWSYIAFFFICGIFQRITEIHISYDDFVFFPFYIGLPIAVAQRNFRDALLAAILGFIALFTVKFPGISLPFMLMADGNLPFYEQYMLVMATIAVMVIFTYLFARYVSPILSYFAVLLWLGFLLLGVPGAIYDIALYSKLLVAFAAAIIVTFIERKYGQIYGIATES